MRAIVCGGRFFSDRELIDAALRQLGVTFVIEGGAGKLDDDGKPVAGADILAGDWAAKNGVPSSRFKPDWKAHGRAAGPIRNQQMLDEGKPEAVIAFPGGRGTADMIRRAERAGVRVIRIPEDLQ